MQEALLNESVSLSAQWYDSSEAESDPGTVTVDVYRDDDTQLETTDSTSGSGTAPRTYTLSNSHTTQQDRLRVVWTASAAATKTTYIEIFDRYFVELDEIRAEPNITTANYSTARLVAARRWFTDLAESYCKTSFIPRFNRELINGNGTYDIQLSRLYIRALLSVKLDGSAVTITNWDIYPTGKVKSYNTIFTRGNNNYSVSYTYGLDYPDHELKLAGLDAIRDWLISDRAGLTARTLSQTNAYMGTTRYSHAGKDKPTGIPHVDAVLNDRKRKLLLIG